ncbi:MAG: PEGA domain-containing protein [Polyangiales bacterium]
MRLFRTLLAGAMVLGVAPQVGAQTPEAATPESPPEAVSADAAEPVAAEAAEPVAEALPEDPNLEEAISRFRQGLTLARAGNCVGAIAELQVSLRLVERPNTLFNIARCQEELFRYDLAVAAYERYMTIAPSDAPDRGAVQETMRQLRNLLGTITVRSNVPAQVWIGDRQVGESPGDVLVPGGRHAVEIRADGYLSTRREVEVASRATALVDVELESAEVINNTNITNENITNVETTNVTEEGGAPVGVFIGAAVLTAASLATAAALSFRVLSLNSDGEALPAYDLEARNAQNERIANKAKVADVFWGVTGALAITTTVLIFLTDWGGDEHEEGTTVTPVAGQGTLGLQVGGSF